MEPGVHMDPAVNPAEEVSRKGAGLAIAQHHHEGGKDCSGPNSETTSCNTFKCSSRLHFHFIDVPQE